jgi:dihydrofolate reductase
LKLTHRQARNSIRKVKLAICVALDGVVENPAWTGRFWNDELAKLQYDYLFASDALLLGRVTSEGFAAAWPEMTETGDFGVKMNTMPKYVASRTLKNEIAEWNASIIQGDVAAEVAKLKEQPGQDLLIYGSGNLVDELTRHRLIDEYHLMVFPVIVGAGKPLFDELATTTLRLENVTSTATGVAVLTYAIVRDVAA